MPKFVDLMILSLAMAACSPLQVKSGDNGRPTIAAYQFRPAATAASASPTPKEPDIPVAVAAPAALEPNSYGCKQTQNLVPQAVMRCCLSIPPYRACHETELSRAASFSERNTVRMGGKEVPSYRYFKEGISPTVYMNYLAGAANNATELAGALGAFITYQTIADDHLLAPEEIIARGAGDCDNIANLFVELLGEMGKKRGYDYQAKVIGLSNADHAVAVFVDTDGQWKSFDQVLPLRTIPMNHGKLELLKASSVFERSKAKGRYYQRKTLAPGAGIGSTIDLFLDIATLMPNGKDISVTLNLAYDPSLNIDELLAGISWRQSALTHLHYRNAVVSYYRNGDLIQLTEGSKFSFFRNNHVHQVQYDHHRTLSLENFSST